MPRLDSSRVGRSLASSHARITSRQAAVATIAALVAMAALPGVAWSAGATAATDGATVSIDWWIYLASLAGLLVVTLLLHVMVKHAAKGGTPGKKHGVATLILGLDNRTSTSKLQAFLWTCAVLWALVSLLVGAGVEDFYRVLDEEPREEYLLLLGGPYAAAIAAKAITTNRAQEKDAREENATVSERLVEVVANDEGGLDLGDFQYAAFTLVALAYFAWAFIKTPAAGLPPIPATLLVLTGVSLSAYVAKKGLKTRTSDASGAAGTAS